MFPINGRLPLFNTFYYNSHVETILLQTKLYSPRLRKAFVPRPRLIQKLNRGLHRKLTLISAPAGFGKTTLVSEWIAVGERPFAWLSLDEGDSELPRFLAYFIAALQSLALSSAEGIAPSLGEGVLGILKSPQLPPIESVLTALINEIAVIPQEFALVLDDYHMVDAPAIDRALTFLLDHLPPQMHLVITTREDPNLSLSRLRVRSQLSEIRASDLRFTAVETAVFLNQMMGLTISEDNIAALETRTEGWIAGLQLAALSMQNNQDDTADFINAFSGSDRFVLDYLVEEVLHQQPESVHKFLLYTSILDSFCSPLCEAVLDDPAVTAQKTLAYLEQVNLFIIPLDNKRRWYRYHHLFADLLQQRLQQSIEAEDINALHIRASAWYAANGLEIKAFHHATAANDVDRAIRLIEGDGLPLYFRGEVVPVQNWLDALPASEFKARPALWVTYASVLTLTGRLHDNIEEILEAAETALQDAPRDDQTNDLLGQIAAIRAMLGVPKNQVETIIAQSRHALELLRPDNAPMRATTSWTLGYAYQVQGDRVAASQAYAETIAHSRKTGNIMTEIAAMTCLGQIQETENQLHQAAESFHHILELMGDSPWPAACEACVGLARIHYQWNDLETAAQYGQQGLELAQQLENVDTPAACGVLLARVKLAQGDSAGALALLAEAEHFVQRKQFVHWVGVITAVRIQTFLHQGKLTAATQLAETLELPLSQARVKLAQSDPTGALAALEPVRQQAEAKGWADEQLRVMVLQALAYNAAGESEKGVQLLSAALALAESGGLVRLFVDEGPAMAALLRVALKQDVAPDFVRQLLVALGATAVAQPQTTQPLTDPLSERELEVLKLLTTELSGPEIARELTVSLNTLRTHTKNIYSKLGVNSRRTAVRRAEELGLL